MKSLVTPTLKSFRPGIVNLYITSNDKPEPSTPRNSLQPLTDQNSAGNGQTVPNSNQGMTSDNAIERDLPVVYGDEIREDHSEQCNVDSSPLYTEKNESCNGSKD